MRTRVRQGQAVIGVTFFWGLGLNKYFFPSGVALSEGAVVPTAERSSGSNASAAPCFCHDKTALFKFWLKPG